MIPVSATPTDVYVAINSQYHDYVELFKSWFGDNVDQKIIESAIIFWFKDVDCKAENKVVEYLCPYCKYFYMLLISVLFTILQICKTLLTFALF